VVFSSIVDAKVENKAASVYKTVSFVWQSALRILTILV